VLNAPSIDWPHDLLEGEVEVLVDAYGSLH